MKTTLIALGILVCQTACSHINSNNTTNLSNDTTDQKPPIEQISNQMEPKGTIYKSLSNNDYLQVDMRLEEDGTVNGVWGWSDKKPEKIYIEIREAEVMEDGGVWFAYFEAKIPKLGKFINVIAEEDKISLITDDGQVLKFVKQ